MRHLIYGGSVAHRLMNCPASFKLSEKMPKGGGSNPAADEGTMLHNACELLMAVWLRDRNLEQIQSLAANMVGIHEYNGVHLTYDLLTIKLLPAIHTAIELVKDADAVVIEQFVEAEADLVGGSVDLMFKRGDTLGVIDYKFGFWPVSVVNNTQLNFYALCTLSDEKACDALGIESYSDIEMIETTIIQPSEDKLLHSEPVFETYLFPAKDLDRFENSLFTAIERAESDNATDYIQAGSHCKYCPVHAVCPLITGEARKARMLTLETSNDLAEAMQLVELLEPWIKNVKALTHEQLEIGNQISGFKLVQKRALRQWAADEKTIEKAIGRRLKKSEIYDTKLKTPAQMEKLLLTNGKDKEIIEPFIAKRSSGTTLAKESDKRPAVPSIQALDEL